jgi:hypothetical protein
MLPAHVPFMAEIHQIIRRHGVEAARKQAVSAHERAVVEAAYRVMSEEAESIGFTYSGFALTSLPHKEPRLLMGSGVMGPGLGSGTEQPL